MSGCAFECLGHVNSGQDTLVHEACRQFRRVFAIGLNDLLGAFQQSVQFCINGGDHVPRSNAEVRQRNQTVTETLPLKSLHQECGGMGQVALRAGIGPDPRTTSAARPPSMTVT